MEPRRLALGAAALVAAGIAILIPAVAHEGHASVDTATSDAEAPRRVSPQTAALIGLEMAEVDFARIDEVVRLAGFVEPVPGLARAVSPRTAGVVSRVHVQVGDRVAAGQVVAELDSPDLARLRYDLRRLDAERESAAAAANRADADVRALRIELPAALATAELAEAEIGRLAGAGEAVAANALASRRAEALQLRAQAELKAAAFEQAHAEAASLHAQARAIDLSLEALRDVIGDSADEQGASAGDIRLLAPISGVVTRRAVLEGQGVEAGQDILHIADFSSVQIFGELPESLVDQVADTNGATVRIHRVGVSEPSIEGVVRFVSPVVDAIRRTTHVIVHTENPGERLRQGMFVELAVVLSSEEPVVAVPSDAVLRDGPARFVWLQEEDLLVRREIVTGASDDRFIEVKDGLVPGDVVVSRGAFAVSQLRGVGPAAEPPAPDAHGHTH